MIARRSLRGCLLLGLIAGPVAVGVQQVTAGATPPRPVGNVWLWSQDSGSSTWVSVSAGSSLDTRYQRVCWSVGDAPPATPGAADECDAVASYARSAITVADGQHYAVSVFAYDKATRLYSTPKSRTFTAHSGATSPFPRESYATGAQSWYLAWDNQAGVTSWSISVKTGVDPASDGATPVATVATDTSSDETSYELSGLEPNLTYTVFVEPEGPSGPLALPSAKTISPHEGGGYWTSSAAGIQTQDLVPSSGTNRLGGFTGVNAAMTTGGRLDVAYVRGLDSGVCGCDTHTVVSYAGRSAAGAWSTPETVADGSLGDEPVMVSSNHDVVVVAWEAVNDTEQSVHLRIRRHGAWGPIRSELAGTSYEEAVLGLVVDRAGYVHLLLNHSGPRGFSRVYVTDTSGRWTHTTVPGNTGGYLAYDRPADRVVFAGERSVDGTTSYYVGAIPSTATSFPGFSRRYSTRDVHPLHVTGVTSSGRNITVALERSLREWRPEGGIYLMSGHRADHVGGPTRVKGTGRFAHALSVTAALPRQVQLTWAVTENDFAPWQHAGVYTARRSLGADGRWRTNTPTQRTSGGDDVNPIAFRDPDGFTQIIYEKRLEYTTERFDD